MNGRVVAFCVGYSFIILAFVVTMANWASHMPQQPSTRPPRFVTATLGPTHTICLRIGEQVVPDTCRTVNGEVTVSIRVVTMTPTPEP